MIQRNDVQSNEELCRFAQPAADDHFTLPASFIPSVCHGLSQMLEAFELAEDAGCDPWEFALEIPDLRRLGISSSQLRWLLRKDFIEHAIEDSLIGDEQRSFKPTSSLSFTDSSCFVLTGPGEQLARSLGPEYGLVSSAESTSRYSAYREPRMPHAQVEEPEVEVPVWDPDVRELRFRSAVVKRYRVPSPNQQMVLTAFEEEQWTCRVDDPLLPHPEIDPKRRLHDTIKSLNRHQISPVLRFYGDGTGEGVRWGLVG